MATVNFYNRADLHTVNGQYGYVLDTSNTSTTLSWGALDTGFSPPSSIYFNSDVYIRHSDSSETLIGNGIAQTTRTVNGSGQQSATWSCPETSLATTDALKIVQRVYSDDNFLRTFISSRLGQTQLDEATWTFNRFTQVNVTYGSPPGQYRWVIGASHGNTTPYILTSNITYSNAVEIDAIALELTSTLKSPSITGDNNLSVSALDSVLNVKPVTLQSSYTVDDGSLTLTLLGPSVRTDSNVTITVQTITATLGTHTVNSSCSFTQDRSLNLKTTVKAATIHIQRYIRNPIDKSGCPFCGTYLYRRGANQVSKRRIYSEPVRSGRNFDRGEYKDDAYIKCSKCGFVCNTQRDQNAPQGSRVGWGLKYVEERRDD